MPERSERPVWKVPEHLAPYTAHTTHQERAEELYNSRATSFNNLPVFVMHVETVTEWALLERLHAAGLLKEQP